MEFVKIGKKYLIKGSNGRIISEKEKLQLENNELKLKNEDCGCACPDKIKKISKNNKKIKEIIEKENKKQDEEQLTIDTALDEVQDDIIKETDKLI